MMTGRDLSADVRGGIAPALGRVRSADVVVLVGVGAAYYLGARVGLQLSLVERNVTPLWPPTGVALAAFLLFGRRMWPAVAVAALAVNLPISNGLLPAAVTAVGNTVAPLTAAVLLQRVGFRRQLDRSRDAVAIVFLAALGSMLISATTGSLSLYLSGAIERDSVLSAGAVWWTGDAMGVLVVAPFLLCLPLFWEQPDWTTARWIEEAAILVVVAGVAAWTTLNDLPVLFIMLPVVGWAAWRLQLRAAAPAALVASIMATWAATHGHGPFAGGTLFQRMLSLQAFNVCLALTSFFLAALVSERSRATTALAGAAAELEERVDRRTSELSMANARLLHEIHERALAQELLGREELRAKREHQIAETLQRSLLPGRLPDIPDATLAARYVPSSGDMQIGGDWYDVVQLPGGLIALAIGDVAGHGLQAAATMGQLRMALRAHALHDPSPVEVLRGVHHLVAQLPMPEMATLIYLVLDPETRLLRYANAGHPPALVVADGHGRFLEEGLAPPLGVTADDHYTEASTQLPEGAVLLLYTDGLVERRGASVQEGLDRLEALVAAQQGTDLEELCDTVLGALADHHRHADDIAILALRLEPALAGPLHLSVVAEPSVLAHVRRSLRRWLRDAGVSEPDANEVLIAVGEACANVVQHAYDATPGPLEVSVTLDDDDLTVTVGDRGQWRPVADRGGGWGVALMEGLMDSVEVSRATSHSDGGGGSTVTMRRRVVLGSPV